MNLAQTTSRPERQPSLSPGRMAPPSPPTALAPAELPLGIVTAAIGVPFFLFLLLRQRRQ